MASNGERSHLTNQISSHARHGEALTFSDLSPTTIRMSKRRRQLRQGDRSHWMPRRNGQRRHHGHQSIQSTVAPAAARQRRCSSLNCRAFKRAGKGCAGARKERREFAVATPSARHQRIEAIMISTLDMRMYNHPLRRKISPTAAAARPPEHEEVKKEGAHSRRHRDRPSEHPSFAPSLPAESAGFSVAAGRRRLPPAKDTDMDDNKNRGDETMRTGLVGR